MRIPADTRDKFWRRLEREIQRSAARKDTSLRLSGSWKKRVGTQGGHTIYAVDGSWVRRNLSVIFGHGGHGYVHEFIPHDEIWVSTTHFSGPWNVCGCVTAKGRLIRDGRKVSRQYFESTVIHEIAEFREMKKDVSYWRAHQHALSREREANLLTDPFTEVY